MKKRGIRLIIALIIGVIGIQAYAEVETKTKDTKCIENTININENCHKNQAKAKSNPTPLSQPTIIKKDCCEDKIEIEKIKIDLKYLQNKLPDKEDRFNLTLNIMMTITGAAGIFILAMGTIMGYDVRKLKREIDDTKKDAESIKEANKQDLETKREELKKAFDERTSGLKDLENNYKTQIESLNNMTIAIAKLMTDVANSNVEITRKMSALDIAFNNISQKYGGTNKENEAAQSNDKMTGTAKESSELTPLAEQLEKILKNASITEIIPRGSNAFEKEENKDGGN
jgi:uncharacterized membrane-anchored protein YhcB (DUF1043 family)